MGAAQASDAAPTSGRGKEEEGGRRGKGGRGNATYSSMSRGRTYKSMVRPITVHAPLLHTSEKVAAVPKAVLNGRTTGREINETEMKRCKTKG